MVAYRLHYAHVELRTTPDFDKWLSKLKDPVAKRQVALRLTRLQAGNAGDTKRLDERLYERRIFTGPGYRIYYTWQGTRIILLLSGGDKSSQSRDIDRARRMIEELHREAQT